MKWNPFKKKQTQQPKTKWQEWRESLIFAVTVATLFRWSLVEAFVIPTPSMENSLLVGDYLFVSKITYGPRTPRTPLQIPLTHQTIWGTNIPSYLTWVELPSFRLPGFRSVERGESVVFNVPKNLLDPKERPIDLKTYLVKRCVGIPGDQLEVRNRQLFVNGAAQENPSGMKFGYLVIARDEINQRHLDELDFRSDDYMYLGRTPEGKAAYNMFLTEADLKKVRALPFILSAEHNDEAFNQHETILFPSGLSSLWTRDNYGAITIPAKGMKVAVNEDMLALYGEIISKYEGHEKVTISGGSLQINGQPTTEYTFVQDYYFMIGDSRHNSLDSRYWGFVPEDHILGKPLFIWMSIDPEAGLTKKIRWNRLFTGIH